MDLLGALNPTIQQGAANNALTAQQQKQAQDLATMLQKEGQTQDKKFTSPWQVAGQWANALAGKVKQNQLNQGYATLNSLDQPGASGVPPAAPPGTPSPAPTVDPSALPWSRTDAGTPTDATMG